MYWASSCGGCEISLVNIHEHLLDVAAHFDFVFCPCLLDTKTRDIEAMADGEMLITFFNGALRTSENVEMAHLLRRKSQLLIAYGSCASEGCIPALANLSSKQSLFDTVYGPGPSIDNPAHVVPAPETPIPEGTPLRLPVFNDRVQTLAQAVDVDYVIPGCPPESHQVWAVIEHVIQGKPLPAKGSVLGAGDKTVCDECKRVKQEKKVTRFYRTYEIIPDPEQCLLEQGLVCMGIATRSGCGGLCPDVNMPCIGCYGPAAGVKDQGARMIGALGAIIDVKPMTEMGEGRLAAHLAHVLDGIPDLAGTLYKFSMAGSLLQGGYASAPDHAESAAATTAGSATQ
jgi:F420-non-reducing hydrogenase small subunit